MAERDAEVHAFLNAAGWGGATRGPLAGDASFRRYERLADGMRRAVLMDAPPPMENVEPFVRIAGHLRGLGLSAPEIFAADLEHGLVVLEDFGDAVLGRLLADGEDPWPLYAMAVDTLAALHTAQKSADLPDSVPPYDEGPLMAEAFLLTDWYMPAIFGCPTPDAVRESYGDAWRAVLAPVLEAPRTLVLRDYFVDNLMLLDGRDGVARLGLLDFQDALLGPAAYDLVSLLEDARRDVAPDLTAAMRARYAAARPDAAGAAFDAVYRILGAQRHAKVIGIFTRLCMRDGKPGYLRHIPRLWRLLENAVADPALAPVAEWLNTHIVEEKRGVPKWPSRR